MAPLIDWDPKPAERTYYRSRIDGQRAYLVKRNGVDILRLDRPMEEILHKLDEGWIADSQSYPMSLHQAAKIAFVADRALCKAIGDHLDAKEEWVNVPEKERIRFMTDGPDMGGIRDKLFVSVMGTLKELTGG